MSDTLIKKLIELVELVKAAAPAAPKMPTMGGANNSIKTPNLAPSLRLPGASPAQSKVQALSTTSSAKSKKDPMHQAKQIQNNDTARQYAMNQASIQNKAMSNQLAFGKSEAEEKRFHLVRENHQAGPAKTESEILSEYGSFAEAEKQGFKVVPVVKEYLKMDGNGQWNLLEKRAPEGVDPEKHERCVMDLKEQGKDVGSAHAICSASMKKDDKIDEMIRTKMKQEMDRRGLTDKDVADHYRDIDTSIPEKHRANIKAALKQQKIKEQPKPKLTVVKGEELEKGLKSAVTSGLVGASMLIGGGGKVQAAPVKAPEVFSDSATGNQLSTGNGSSAVGGEYTYRTNTYGPYQVSTLYDPNNGGGQKSYRMIHHVSWNGTPSPVHQAAVAKEYGIDAKNLQNLKPNLNHSDDGDRWIKGTGAQLSHSGKGEPSGSLYESKDPKSPINQIKLVKNLFGQWMLTNNESEIKVDLSKSNEIKPVIAGQKVNVYDSTANLNRKATRTGEVRPEMGGNQAVRSYTTSGSSVQAAHEANEAKAQKKKSKASVRTLKDMSEDELNAIKARYDNK